MELHEFGTEARDHKHSGQGDGGYIDNNEDDAADIIDSMDNDDNDAYDETVKLVLCWVAPRVP